MRHVLSGKRMSRLREESLISINVILCDSSASLLRRLLKYASLASIIGSAWIPKSNFPERVRCRVPAESEATQHRYQERYCTCPRCSCTGTLAPPGSRRSHDVPRHPSRSNSGRCTSQSSRSASGCMVFLEFGLGLPLLWHPELKASASTRCNTCSWPGPCQTSVDLDEVDEV